MICPIDLMMSSYLPMVTSQKVSRATDFVYVSYVDQTHAKLSRILSSCFSVVLGTTHSAIHKQASFSCLPPERSLPLARHSVNPHLRTPPTSCFQNNRNVQYPAGYGSTSRVKSLATEDRHPIIGSFEIEKWSKKVPKES